MRSSIINHKWVLPSFFAFLLIAAAWIPGSAQQVLSKPGPISQLMINDQGDIQCDMHASNATANNYQRLGRSYPELERRAHQKVTKHKKSPTGVDIFVFYLNLDPDFPNSEFFAAVDAYQSAVDIWSNSLSSDVPVFVLALFQKLEPNVLGAAGSTLVLANAPGLERNTWYGNALADKLAGEDLAPEFFDIVSFFSTVFPNWYYGTDGNTPSGDFDFRTVVLHELCHGLGFFGSMLVDNSTGVGTYGFGSTNPLYPAIYDRLMYTDDGKAILKENRYPYGTTALGDALLSDPLTAKGPNTKGATNGKGAKIFTILDSDIFGDIPGFTDIWLRGSSYSHLDFVTYAGRANGLMVPFLFPGLSYSAPGKIVLGIFDDIGWNGKVNREVMARVSPTDAVSTTDARSFSGVRVFPNPVKQSLTVQLGKYASPLIKANLIDADGRKHGLTFSPGQQQSSVHFDLSELRLAPGLFTLQLGFENEEVANIKVVKVE